MKSLHCSRINFCRRLSEKKLEVRRTNEKKLMKERLSKGNFSMIQLLVDGSHI
jgi:hypothetical protein